MFTLGIAGGSGSGKTTLIDHILRGPCGRDVALLPHDAYYLSKVDMPAEVWENENWDHPDALDNRLFLEHLDALRAGLPIEKPVYDFGTHSRSGVTERIEPKPVILVDGILLFAIPEILRRLDLKVFVDTPPDLRITRRIARDMAERKRTPESVIKQYVTTVRPMHMQYVEPSRGFAEIIIPWEFHNDEAVRVLTARIKEHINPDEDGEGLA